MLDAIELRVPLEIPRREEFWSRHKSKPANRGLLYMNTVDFRPELSLVIHYGHCRPIPKGDKHYKLQFRRPKLLTEHDLISHVMRVFEIDDGDVRGLKISRVDFTADVYNVPVQWFRERTRDKG